MTFESLVLGDIVVCFIYILKMPNFRLPKSEEELKKLLENIKSGYKEKDDTLFQTCDSYIPKFKKQGVLTPLDDEEDAPRK